MHDLIITNVTWRYRKLFSQWKHTLHLNSCSHWWKGFRERQMPTCGCFQMLRLTCRNWANLMWISAMAVPFTAYYRPAASASICTNLVQRISSRQAVLSGVRHDDVMIWFFPIPGLLRHISNIFSSQKGPRFGSWTGCLANSLAVCNFKYHCAHATLKLTCCTCPWDIDQCWRVLKGTLKKKEQLNFNHSVKSLFKVMHKEMSSTRCRPFCPGPDVSIYWWQVLCLSSTGAHFTNTD